MIFAILGLNVIAWRRFFKKGNSERTASAEKVLLMTLFSKMAIKRKIRSGKLNGSFFNPVYPGILGHIAGNPPALSELTPRARRRGSVSDLFLRLFAHTSPASGAA